jgi:hypothetical protein
VRGTLLVARSEWYRDVRARSTWILALLVALVPAARVVAWRIAEAPARLRLAQSGDGGDDLGGTGWAPLVESWRFGLVLGALALLIHFARGLAGDRDAQIARLAVTRSVSRGALVTGRALLAPIYVLAVVALTGVTAWLSVGATYPFGDLEVDGYTLVTSDELIAELERAILITLPALVALCCTGLLVSVVSRSAVAAVALAATGFLGFDLFKELLGEYAPMVFATWVPSIFDESALAETVQVALGYSDAGLATESVRFAAILPWPQALVALVLAAWIATRRRL